MDNSADKKLYNLKIYFLFSIVSLMAFSCGPRSGVSKSENIDSDQPIDYVVSDKNWCGNAVMDSQNYDWAIKELKLDGDGNHGYKLFKQNCAVCHALSDQKLTGPGLAGAYWRLPDPKAQWLKGYILNSDSIRKSGDPYAKKLHSEYAETPMTVFAGQLTDQEINDIMIYVVGNTK
jgi:mono/diheme cytochrome c family protein